MENVMSKSDFANALVDMLYATYPDMAETHEIGLREVTKNNGTILTGLTIRENSENIAPTIYVESMYEDYLDGAGLEELTERIMDTYQNNKLPNDFSVDFFNDFAQIKDRIMMKVINADRNEQMLAETPHYTFGDLAAIFQVQMDSVEFGSAVVTVKDEHMKMWGVDTGTLMKHAKENLETKQPPYIMSMAQVIAEMMDIPPEEMFDANQPAMYVMCNESKINGAAAMVFTEKLDEFAVEHGANLYVLPSSIHEIIIIPDNLNSIDKNVLESMVRDVNATQVSAEEFLSNNVYYYNRDDKCLFIAETMEPCVLHSDGKDFRNTKEKKEPEKSEPKTIKERLAEGKEKAANNNVVRHERGKELNYADKC